MLIGEVLLQRTPRRECRARVRGGPPPLARPRAACRGTGRDRLGSIRPLGLAKRAQTSRAPARSWKREGCRASRKSSTCSPASARTRRAPFPVFAGGRDLPLVDWVVARVLRRYFGLANDRRPNADPELWDLAEQLARPAGRARGPLAGDAGLRRCGLPPPSPLRGLPARGELRLRRRRGVHGWGGDTLDLHACKLLGGEGIALGVVHAGRPVRRRWRNDARIRAGRLRPSEFAVEHNAGAARRGRGDFGSHVFAGPVQEVERFPEADVMIGGPPCQGFTPLGRDLDSKSARRLTRPMAGEYLRALRAEFEAVAFVMENVPEC